MNKPYSGTGPAITLPIVTPPSLFRDDSEVKWAELHHSSEVLLFGRCVTCGNKIGDDRYHFFFAVTPMSEQFAEVAKVYEIFLHRRRREIATRLSARSIHELLFGIEDISPIQGMIDADK